MKNIFTLLFLSLISFYSFSQSVIKGTVCSKDSNYFVPYCTIQVKGTKNIVDADEKGYFEISVPSEKDSLLITSIGYKDCIVSTGYFKNTDSVFLEEKFLKMEEVVIKNPVIETFGIVNEKMGSSRVGGDNAERSELTTLIEIPEKIESYRISKIFIKGRRFIAENPVQLHIYSVNENGLPEEELLKKPVIITNEQFAKNNIITIDVKDQNIILDNASFFVGIRWMTSLKVKMFTGPEIIQTNKVSKVLSYYRQADFLKNFWWVEYKGPVIQVFKDGKLPPIGPLGKGNPLNMRASAEIEAFSN